MTAQEHAGIAAYDHVCAHPDASDDEIVDMAADCSGLAVEEARQVLLANAQISEDA